MSRLLRFSGVLLTALLVLTACRSAKPTLKLVDYDRIIRVACVGDSITYGAGVENREVNCYPAVLGRLLGQKFEVRNFGVSGATMLGKGDLPYQKLAQYEEAVRFQPDVVIVKLGTNDSKPQNWAHAKDFTGDLNAMLDRFSHLPGHPKIWLCLPVPAYAVQWGINDDVIVNGVIPAIKKAAQSRKIPVIDLYDALSNRPDLFPDKIHPNAKGAELMARTIQNALLGQ